MQQTTTTRHPITPASLRIHPQIPIKSEHDSLKFSDHVAILVENLPVPVVESSLMSLNTMQVSHHGDHLYHHGGSTEADAYQRARMQRIIQFLTSAVRENPDITIIHLQEARENQLSLDNPEDFKFLSLLKNALPEGWDFEANEHSGLATFYNKNRLTLADREDSQPRGGEVMRRLSLTFRDAEGGSDEEFTLHNIHAFYKDMPTLHEVQFRERLKQRPGAIIGDGNLHFAPRELSGLNLATAVADDKSGVGFTGDHPHEPDSPDVAFLCREVNGAVEKCEFKVLDFKTGTVFQFDPNSDPIGERPVYQQQAFGKFKIMPMVEEEYYTEGAPENEYFQIQEALRTLFGNDEIIVRPCVKMSDTGERGFSIAFPKQFFVDNQYALDGFDFQSLQAAHSNQFNPIWLRVFIVPNSQKEALLQKVKALVTVEEKQSLVTVEEKQSFLGSLLSSCCLFSSCCRPQPTGEEFEPLISSTNS